MEIVLREGIYQIDTTIILDESLSNLTITSYPKENATLSAGIQLTNWKQARHNGIDMYEVNVPALQNDNVRQFYINGERGSRANSSQPTTFHQSYPNRINSYYNVGGKASGYVLPLSAVGGDLRNPENIELVFNKNWRSHRMAVSRVSKDGGNVNLYIDPSVMEWSLTADAHMSRPSIGTYCYVENAYGLLDQPNEYYYDKAAGKLYYYPKQGTDMTSADTWIPLGVESIIVLDGQREQQVENIKIEGITFKHSTWNRPSEVGASPVQANFYTNEKGQGSHTDGTKGTGGIQAIPTIDIKDARNITITKNKLENLGTTAIRIANNTQNVKVINNRFYDISESGIVAGIWTHNFLDKKEEGKVSSTVIGNNYMENIGVEFFTSPAIQCYYVEDIMIEHNTIKNVAYGGILLGWNGWQSTEKDSITARNQIVRYNRVENYSNEVGDVGALYTLGQRPNMEIYNNYFLKANRYIGGIYLDEGTGFVSVIHNVVEQNTPLHHGRFLWFNCWIASIHDNYAFGNYTNVRDTNNAGVRVYGANTNRDNYFEGNAGKNGDGTGWSSVPDRIIKNAGVIENYTYINPKVAKDKDVAFGVNAIFRDEHNAEDFGKGYQIVQYAVDGYYKNIGEDPFATSPKLKENYGTSYSKGSYAEASKPENALEVDLLKRYAVNKVEVDFTTDGFLTAYKIVTSIDGMKYKEVARVTENTADNVVTTFATEYARYIKIVPISYNTKVQYVNVSAFVDVMAVEEVIKQPMTIDYLADNMMHHFMVENGPITNGTEFVEKWNTKSGSASFDLPTPWCNGGSDTTTNTPKKPKTLQGVIDGRPSMYFDGFDDGLEANIALSSSDTWTVSYMARAYRDHSIKIYDGSSYTQLSPINAYAKEWALWTFSNHGGNIKVYKNRKLVGERSASNISKIGISGNVDIRFKRGGEVTHGDFTEFIIYNKALAKDEVKALHNSMSIKYPSLVEHKTVNFDSQGGTSIASIETPAYETIVAPNEPIKSGKFFGGWYTDTSYTTLWNFATDEVRNNMTLYALWTDSQEYFTSFSSHKDYIAVDMTVKAQDTQVEAKKLSNGMYRLTAGEYSFEVEASGFKKKVVIVNVDTSKIVYVDSLKASPKANELVDDRDQRIIYKTPSTWSSDNWTPQGVLHKGTRTYNWKVIDNPNVVDMSVLTYTFKGTGIHMYNQKEKGVTNIEVNIYKGRDTTGTKVVSSAIANQRSNVTGTVGFQKTYSSTSLEYGLYTIEIKPLQSDVDNGMNGFITLDAFEVVDSRTEEQPSKYKVTLTAADEIMGYGMNYTVTKVVAGKEGEAVSKEADGSYLLETGQYTYTATSKGYANTTKTFMVQEQPLNLVITMAEENEADIKIDDTAGEIIYTEKWNVDGWTVHGQLYNNTRHYSYGANMAKATVKYTFKGSGIKMYNQMEGGVTNIEVNIYKGVDTMGEKVVSKAVADQRGDVGSMQQTGNCLTYESGALEYGVYTITLNSYQPDVDAGMDGFYTVDAFEVLGRK